MRRQKWDVTELSNEPSQPFAVHCLSPGHATTDPSGQAEESNSGRALLLSLLQVPNSPGTATAWLWALVRSSGLVCPKHPMASAAGKETGKTGNSPSLGPESHQHQNLLEIHITEGLGNRRSREGSPSEGGVYCQQSSPEAFTQLPAAAAAPPMHRATMPWERWQRMVPHPRYPWRKPSARQPRLIPHTTTCVPPLLQGSP